MSIYVDPGPLAKTLFFFGFPAFVLGMGIVRLFGHFGVDELMVFMTVMPFALGTWFYIVGFLLGRKGYRRRSV